MMNLNNQPTIDELARLFAARKDSLDDHLLWISAAGDVHIDRMPPHTAEEAIDAKREMRLVDAVSDGLREGMRHHDNLVIMGQDVAEYGGVFPADVDQLAELPGIGRSTAAAIAAFCFGERVAILDGNVKRVLTRLLAEAVSFQQPKRAGTVRPKLRYAHQGGQNPPIIVIHGNALEHVTDVYKRYLESRFREHFKLQGTPLRIELKSSHNPFDEKS